MLKVKPVMERVRFEKKMKEEEEEEEGQRGCFMGRITDKGDR